MKINTVYFIVEENIPVEDIEKLVTSSMTVIYDSHDPDEESAGWAALMVTKIKSYSKSLETTCRHYKDANKWGEYYVYQCDHHKVEDLEHNGINRQLKHKQVFSFLGKVKEIIV